MHFLKSEEWVEQSLKNALVGGACAYVWSNCACFDIQDEIHGKIRFTSKDAGSMRDFHNLPFIHQDNNPRRVQSQRWRQRIMAINFFYA